MARPNSARLLQRSGGVHSTPFSRHFHARLWSIDHVQLLCLDSPTTGLDFGLERAYALANWKEDKKMRILEYRNQQTQDQTHHPGHEHFWQRARLSRRSFLWTTAATAAGIVVA